MLLLGSQKLTLYTIDEGYEGMTSNYLHGPAGVATYLNDDWLEYAEVALETTLNKGDMLFVPEACVLVSEALDETALDVTLVRSSPYCLSFILSTYHSVFNQQTCGSIQFLRIR